MMEDDFTVNNAENRFEMNVEGAMAIIDFKKEGEVLTLSHTEVPEALQGQGVANQLVGKALNHIKGNNFKVNPSCSFVAAYIERHPEWKEIVA